MYKFSVDGTRQSPVIGKILKDGKPLTSKDVDINVLDDKVTFTFKKPAHDQSGKYQIKLSNEQGEDTKEININMQGNKFKFVFHHSLFKKFSTNAELILQMLRRRQETYKYQKSSKIVANYHGNHQKVQEELLFYTTLLKNKI